MKYKVTYLPDPNQELKRKKMRNSLVLFVLLVALGLTLILNRLLDHRKEQAKEYVTQTICNLDGRSSNELLIKENQHPQENMADYLYYGESLHLFNEKYDLFTADAFRKVVFQLKNLCTGEIYSYLAGDKLDQGIKVSTLDDGFYQIYIQTNIELKKLVSEQIVLDQFVTITADGKRKRVTLMANPAMFTNVDTGKNLFVKGSAYLQVETVDVDEKIIDIMIDPAYNNAEFGPVDKGYESDQFVAADELYNMALQLKQRLSEIGYVVAITRPNQDFTMNTYGDKGRVHAAIDAQAKLMVELSFNEFVDEPGVGVFGSNYVSNNFQDALVKAFKEQDLKMMYNQGSFNTPFYEETQLDTNNLVRESGSYALGAGKFSDKSFQQNYFALENRHGVHTVTVTLLSTQIQSVEQDFQQNLEKYLQALVEGIDLYIKLK